MIEMNIEWINPLPTRIKYKVLKFIFYLSCKNIITGYFKVTTPVGISYHDNILDVPRSVFVPNTGESFQVDLKCVQVVYRLSCIKQ